LEDNYPVPQTTDHAPGSGPRNVSGSGPVPLSGHPKRRVRSLLVGIRDAIQNPYTTERSAAGRVKR